MLERNIQANLIRKYQKEGHYVLRLVQVSKSGVPDLLLLKDGIASFVEVKAPNGVISDVQRLRAKELRAAGCKVRFVTVNDVDIKEGDIEVNEQYGF